MSKKDKGIVEKAKEAVGKAAEKAAEVTGGALDAAGKAAEMAKAGASGRMNRTGLGMSPLQGQQIVKGARDAIPSSPGDVNALTGVRFAYGHDSLPMGTMPPPASVKGLAASAAAAVKGDKATFLLDKLGERLAFERTGVRLYEELITTFDTHGSFPGGPSRDELERARADEAGHFDLLRKAIETLGGDPTAVTPSANIVAVESMGLLQVLADPRSRLADGLHAILVAELADHDGWEMLIELARGAAGLVPDDVITLYGAALIDEQKHLAWVRQWLAAHGRIEASIGPKGPSAQPPSAVP